MKLSRTYSRKTPLRPGLIVATLVGICIWAIGHDASGGSTPERTNGSLDLPAFKGNFIFDPAEGLSAFARPFREAWQPKSAALPKTRGSEDVYRAVAPAVVIVRTRNGYGTGFVIDSEGWVLTNRHVIQDLAVDSKTGTLKGDIYFGRLEDGVMRLVEQPVPAIVYKADAARDLALLKLSSAGPGKRFSFVPLASRGPLPGSDVVSIGHPASAALWSVRRCEVAGISRWPGEMMDVVMRRLSVRTQDREEAQKALAGVPSKSVVVSTCGLNPGDSGGPLVNTKGELEAVSFAIPRGGTDDGISLDKFAYHVHLDEVRAFLAERPASPLVSVPDPWPEARYWDYLDVDRNGIPETLAFSDDPKGPVVAVLVDLDERNAKFPLGDLKDAQKRRRWRFSFGFHIAEERVVFYDTDADGAIDLILFGAKTGEEAISAFQMRNGVWAPAEPRGRKVIDKMNFVSPDRQERFARYMKLINAG